MAHLSYYASRLSDHLGRTPEGYVIAYAVPIARTGWQDYTRREIGLEDGDPSERVRVYRKDKEVFDPTTIASFEGKTITDNHPSEWVGPGNEGSYHRGHVQNVRRGDGQDREFLLADLVIKDALLIDKVLNNNQREVSCGYFCNYDPIGDSDNMFAQSGIRGNHVAVVPNGRAGDRVAIRDAKINNVLESTQQSAINWRARMPEKRTFTKKILLGLGLKTLALDAETTPEDMAEAYEVAAKDELGTSATANVGGGLPEKATGTEKKVIGKDSDTEGSGINHPESPSEPSIVHDAGPADGGSDGRMVSILEKMLNVLERIDQRTEAGAGGPPPEPEEDLDNFADNFGNEGEAPSEGAEEGNPAALEEEEDAAGSFSPEKPGDDDKKGMEAAGEFSPFMDAENSVPPELSGEELPKNPIPGADAKAVKDFASRIKPVLAKIEDKKERQMVVDSFKAIFRRSYRNSARDNGRRSPNYGDLFRTARRDKFGNVTHDAAPNTKAERDAQWADSLREKYHAKWDPRSSKGKK